MILLVGIETDRVLKYFASYLVSQKKDVVFLNQKKLGYTSHIHSNFIVIDGKQISYNSISGSLNRLSDINPNFNGSKHHYHFPALLSYLLDNIISNTLNPVRYCVSNNSKLYQLTNLKLININIPRAIVTAKTSNNIIYSNLNSLNSKFIFKSLSSIRSKVVEFKNIDTQIYEPVLFQELISGNNIRVHVIKQTVVAIKILSSQIDYRYDETFRTFEEIQLPHSIMQECLKLAKQTNLLFCGIDLIELNNKYYILEINPSPGYTFFEEHLEQKKISHALMEALIE